MSYIRCLTNPEGLYIYEGFDNNLDIIMPNKETIVCNADDFYQFVFNWFKYMEDEYIYKNISIKEDKITENGDFKTFITIDSDTIEMWHVTWMYIVYGILHEKVNIYNLLYPENEFE